MDLILEAIYVRAACFIVGVLSKCVQVPQQYAKLGRCEYQFWSCTKISLVPPA
jgi:hypothetical protein